MLRQASVSDLISGRVSRHDGAFARSRFEARFDITAEGLEHLRRLSQLSRKRDVYFICQCHAGRRCHRELILMLARGLFRAKTDQLAHEYPVFASRINEFRQKLKAAGKVTDQAVKPSPDGPRKYSRPRPPSSPAPARARRPRGSPRPAAAKAPRA